MLTHYIENMYAYTLLDNTLPTLLRCPPKEDAFTAKVAIQVCLQTHVAAVVVVSKLIPKEAHCH
jgi:hypothetical protein